MIKITKQIWMKYFEMYKKKKKKSEKMCQHTKNGKKKNTENYTFLCASLKKLSYDR